MPSLADAEKPALLDEQHRLKDLRVAWTAWLAVFGSIAAEVTTAPILIGPLAGVSIVSRVAIERQLNANERALADPPRTDFQTGTKAHRRRYWPGALGDSPVARAADAMVVAALRVVSYREAAVRADERAQGADLSGHKDLEHDRMTEAMWLMERSRTCERALAASLDVLGMAWADAVASDTQLGSVNLPLSSDVAVSLPSQAWEALASTGLVVADLDIADIAMPGSWLEIGERSTSALGLALATAQAARTLALATARVATRSEDLHVQLGVLAGPHRAVSEQYERALVTKEIGDLDQAMALMRSAAEAGSPDAMFELGVSAEAQDDHQGAQRWLRMAAESNPPHLVQEEDCNDGLSPMLTAGEPLVSVPRLTLPVRKREDVRSHDDIGRGTALRDRGDLAGAEQAFRRADERGSPEGAVNLGVLLRDRGDLAGAEQAFRRADERGSPEGTANLGALLLDRGDLVGAQEALRRALERISGRQTN